MIHIELIKSKHKKDAWDIRIGDIDGSVSTYNATKDMILECIAEEMDSHIDVVVDK